MRMEEKLVLNVVARAMIPFILLFGLYVQFHGDFGPGGGFQAGVIFAAGLILFALVFGLDQLQSVLPPDFVERAMAVGVLIYGGVGILDLALGFNFLDYDALSAEHGQHWGILLVEAGVGLTVAATMTKIYYAFAGFEGSP
jgi:multicomponent Na+:H+ antiporter subunit B